jgi:hypothetical protein
MADPKRGYLWRAHEFFLDIWFILTLAWQSSS